MRRTRRMLTSGSSRTLAIRGADPVRADSESPLASFVGRWWLLLLLGSLVGTGAGYAYTKLGPTAYQSSALLDVRPDPSSSRPAPDGEVTAIGFAAQALAPSVLGQVSQALQQDGVLLSSADLLSLSQSNKLTVQPIKGSTTLVVTAVLDNATIAQAVADKVAAVVVDNAGTQAKSASENRRRELLDSISAARDQLTNAQLYQREQDLQQRLQQQRPLLLQLQGTYQQSLAQQAQLALLMRPQVPATTGPPAPTPAQQNQLSTLSATAAEGIANELATLKSQGETADTAIANLDAQLAAVKDQLGALPGPTNADPGNTQTEATTALDLTGKIAALQDQQNQLKDQQGQLQVLQKQAHDLQTQSTDLRSQARTLQTQTQQATVGQQTSAQQQIQQQAQLQQQLQSERDRQGLLKAQIDTIVPLKGATELSDAQSVQLQSFNNQLADSRRKTQDLTNQLNQLGQNVPSSAATDSTVKLLQGQLQDVQQTDAGVQNQLKDVQTRSAALADALGPNPDGKLASIASQILQLQQQQRDQDAANKQTDALRTSLQNQQQELQRQADAQRSARLQIQRQEQDDLQRQVDLNQRNIQTQVAQTPQQPDPAPAMPQLDDTTLRDGLLSQITDQMHQVSTTLDDLNSQLDDVRKAEAALPVKLDPAQAAVQATVAAQSLSQLSAEYTRLQVDEANGVNPLERLGPAAPAMLGGGQLRMLPVGSAAGLVLAAALAYLLQAALRARRRPSRTPRLPSAPNRSLAMARHRAR